MNAVQEIRTPSRLAAAILGGLVFAIYQFGWRDILLAHERWNDPVSLPVAALCAAIIGYGLSALGWLILLTKSQIGGTFRPTRGQLIGTIVMTMITPVSVISWFPWIALGMVLLELLFAPLDAMFVVLAITLLTYPLTAMILRHTGKNRLLRFGLFCLYFSTCYAFLLLWQGEIQFKWSI